MLPNVNNFILIVTIQQNTHIAKGIKRILVDNNKTYYSGDSNIGRMLLQVIALESDDLIH